MKCDQVLYEPTDEMFIYPVVVLMVANTILFLFCQIFRNRDNSYIDIQWGNCAMIPNTVILIMRAMAGEVTPRMLIISIPVYIWGIRLVYYIGVRH